jgi:DedD protein
MAFFKFRKGGDEQAAPPAQPESVEVLRKRAKNRLIGAIILVLIGVVGFPLLVDKEPRQLAVDLPIDIPDRQKVQPLAMPADPAPAPTQAAAGPVTAPQVTEAPATDKPAEAKAPEAKAADPKPVDNKASAAKPADTKAEAKAESKNKADAKHAADTRYVVQVGSFADEGRARDARAKLERAGFKNYTQAVDTKEGKRIRVRAGPFANKAEADRAADKIKKLDLPTAVLSL